ncbi:MAG: ERCC4 domain-containing protein [Candidatus Micrarchaeota archaeon]
MQEQKAKIAVDKRERGFANLLSEFGAEVEEKMLEVGDFVCSEKTIVERKTRSDFEASILDGRFFSQLRNLRANFENVIVVIEGMGNEKTSGHSLSRAALMGAYVSVITDFGASLFFTKNEKSTAELVYSIAKHEQLAKKIKMRIFAKRKSLTLAQTQRSVVEMLPMIGPCMAKKLLIHFGSLEALFCASEEDFLKIEGLGEKKARAVWKTIHETYTKEEDPLYTS